MELKKFTIEGYAKHKKTELDFNNLNLFFGLNDAGKSSIKNALYHLFTGDSVQPDFINREMKACTLTAKFSDITIKRHNTASSMGVGTLTLVDERDQPIEADKSNTDRQKYIYNHFRTSQEQLKALFYSSNFLFKTPEDQLNFISQFLNIEITTVDIANCLPDKVQESFLKKMGDHTGGQELVQECYDRAFNERRDANRVFKLHTKEIEKGFVSVLPEGVTLDRKVEAEKAIEKLEEKRTGLYELKGKLKAGLDPEEIKSYQEGLDANKAFLQKHPAKTYEEDIQKCREYLKKYEGSAVKYRNQIDETKGSIRALEAEIKTYDPFIKDLENFKGECPLFKSIGIKCELDPKKAMESLVSKIKEKQIEIKKLRGSLEKYETNLKAYKLEETRDRVEKDNEILKKIGIAQNELERVEKLLKTNQATGESDPAKVNADIDAIEQRIQKGRGLLNIMIQEETNKKNWKELEEKFVLSKRDADQWNEIVKALDVGAVKNKLLNTQLVEFRQKIQANIEEFSGYRVTFDFEKEFKILVDGFERDSMGRSKQQSFNIAFQVALAGYMGLPLLIVDDMDMFDYKNATKISQYFVKLAKKFDVILAFAAMKTDTIVRPNNKTPFLNVFHLDDGIVQSMGEK